MIYNKEKVVEKNLKKAVRLCSIEFDECHLSAAYNFAKCYEKRIFFIGNLKDDFQSFQYATGIDHSLAPYNCFNLIFGNEKYTDKNLIVDSINLYQLSSANNFGTPQKFNNLTTCRFGDSQTYNWFIQMILCICILRFLVQSLEKDC